MQAPLPLSTCRPPDTTKHSPSSHLKTQTQVPSGPTCKDTQEQHATQDSFIGFGPSDTPASPILTPNTTHKRPTPTPAATAAPPPAELTQRMNSSSSPLPPPTTPYRAPSPTNISSPLRTSGDTDQAKPQSDLTLGSSHPSAKSKPVSDLSADQVHAGPGSNDSERLFHDPIFSGAMGLLQQEEEQSEQGTHASGGNTTNTADFTLMPSLRSLLPSKSQDKKDGSRNFRREDSNRDGARDLGFMKGGTMKGG